MPVISRILCVCLVAFILGWSCPANGQAVESIVFISNGPPEVAGPFVVFCDATVTGVTTAMVTISGPGGSQSNSPPPGNGVFRGTRIFTPISASDSGVYTCSVMADGSTLGSASAVLDVDDEFFLHTSVSVPGDPVTVGVNYVLTCSATIVVPSMSTFMPSVDFQWTGPGGSTINPSEFIAIASIGLTSSLQFSPAQQSQGGRYTCQATANSQVASNFAEVDEAMVPEITASISAPGIPMLGSSFSFTCQVAIANNIDISASLSYTLDRDPQTTANVAALPVVTFAAITLADAGSYRCSVMVSSPFITNDIAVSTNVPLNIFFTLPAPPVNLISDIASPVPLLSSPMLSCIVDLSAINLGGSLVFRWMGPDSFSMSSSQPLSGSDPSVEGMVTLNAVNFGSGDGEYECSAQVFINALSGFILGNGATGSDTILIEIQVFTPSPPTVTAVLAGNRVSLEWTQPQTDVVAEFTIQVSTTPMQCVAVVPTVDAMVPGSERAFLTAPVEDFSNIIVVVTAMNTAGEGSAPAILILTPPATPDGIPQQLRADVPTPSDSITILWDRVNCVQRNSEITRYMITYGRTGGTRVTRQLLEENVATIVGTGAADRIFTATGLLPRTSYTFNVMAVNVANEIGPPATLTVVTGTPAGLTLSHLSQNLPNNSIVAITDIGVDLLALFCFTNQEECCESVTGAGWRFPDDTAVGSSGDVFESRGLSILGLNRASDAVVVNGIYRCEIPDAQGDSQCLYTGVYSDGTGVPELESLDYDSSTGLLICTSTGGPVTEVVWQKDGVVPGASFQRSKIITDTASAAYANTLLLNGAPDAVVGSYTCSVSNSRGSSATSEARELKGLQLTGLESEYNIGDDVSITCSTDLRVDRIVWLNADETEMATTDGTQLTFNLTSVTAAMNQLQFMCRVESGFGDQVQVIVIVVSPGGDGSSTGAVAGGVIGAILAILLLVAAIIIGVYVYKRIKRDDPPPQYEMGAFKPSMPVDDEEGDFYPDGRDVVRNHSVSIDTDSQEKGWRKLDKADSTENLIQSTFINEEAIYVNSTFKARDREEPVAVKHFESHVQQMHAGKNFETEYMLISRTPQVSYDVSCIPCNKIRNRFANIFPYDFNRVVLKSIMGVKGSDYINASFVDGYNKNKAYIASQGPNPESLSDFWRMIWEYRIPTIAMLTRCYEGGKKKCVQYYPEKLEDPMFPGQNLSVSLISIMAFASYTVRKMSVRSTAEPDMPPLDVIQFHFLGWPDHGVPTNAMTVINFVKQVRKTHPYSSNSHLLVHCSAGVGRTGTFMTLDSMLERIKDEGTLSIFPFVRHIRSQRVLMVQTLVQYVFIFDALNEYIICGETEMVADNIKETYDAMCELIPEGDEGESMVTGFEQQYQLLNHMTHVIPEAKYGHAKAPYNAVKNRYPNRIPNYFTRVRLRPSAVEGSDYINASFIDGYKSTQAFIATQAPLENTVNDFWRMIYEYRSKCIVMLCKLVEEGTESSYPYWPDSTFSQVEYGKITVIKTAEQEFEDYVMRKFEITGVPVKSLSVNSNNLSPSFVVTHLQYLNWPEEQTPKDTASMIELVDKVNKVQMASGNKSITVMCNNGVGRTGTFIAAYSQMERLKSEGEADFFQYVKSVRIQRAGLILNADQYQFCHRVLVDYLDAFKEYANFKS